MNLALSNFAWDFENIKQVSETLKKNNINQVELVFSKYKDWSELKESDVYDIKKLLNTNGLNCLSTQSLFFGVGCESIIDDSENFINHFKKIILYSKIIGIKILVFGSPNLRKLNNRNKSYLHKIFKMIDKILNDTGIILCIEPNTKKYGGHFFFTIEEIVNFIKTSNFNNIFTMCDTHNSWLENKDPYLEVERYFPYIKHIHISEPKLIPITQIEFHKNFSKKLKDLGFNGTITYELIKCDELPESLNIFYNLYN